MKLIKNSITFQEPEQTAKILWDDRDLFYIPKPDDATINEILHFF